ncbi:MAG: hypothetical protein Kow0081_2860 [Candidatus Dojkabacteria bacterium]
MELSGNSVNAKYYDIIYSLVKGDDVVAAEVDLICSVLPTNAKNIAILDIGCGTGRHSIPLAKLLPNCSITALDLTTEILNIAKQKALKEKIFNISFKNLNFYEFSSSTKFDLVVLFWNSLNEIALSDKDLELFFTKLKSLLKKGAKVIINVDDVENVVVIPEIDHLMSITKGEKKYELEWKVKEFKKDSFITISEEKITVYDKEGNIIEQSNGEIIQKWWTKKEIARSAKNFMLTLQNSVHLTVNDELYLIFTNEFGADKKTGER